MDLARTEGNGEGDSGKDTQKTIENGIDFLGTVMDRQTIPARFTCLAISQSRRARSATRSGKLYGNRNGRTEESNP